MTRRSVRDAWLSEVLRSPLIGDACRVLLIHMATLTAVTTKGGYPMTDTGRIKVGREELAEALGVKPNRITNRITEATRAGLLRKVGGGHNGQTAIYAAQVQGPRKGVGKTDTYSGPESLAGLMKVSVLQVPTRSPEPIPTPVKHGEVGIGGGDTIRVRVTKTNHNNGAPSALERGAAEQHSGNESSAAPRRPALALAPPIRRACA